MDEISRFFIPAKKITEVAINADIEYLFVFPVCWINSILSVGESGLQALEERYLHIKENIIKIIIPDIK